MEKEKINIAELLRDCPKGMELYSPLCGTCVFDHINYGTIICKKQNTQEITFTSDGYYMLPVFDNCECMIFPSKDQRDWSKFHRPFRDGDILFVKGVFSWVLIYKESENQDNLYKYVAIPYHSSHTYMVYDNKPLCCKEDISEIRFATIEERQNLFNTLKKCGYKWNDKTKTLEKLLMFKVGDKIRHKTHIRQENVVTEIKDTHYILDNELALPFISQYKYELVPTGPRFKVGDRVKSMYNNNQYDIKELTDNHYVLVEVINKFKYTEPIIEDKNWELVPNKFDMFDINTLIPFDKVLVREDDNKRWRIQFFERLNNILKAKFVCMNGYRYHQCIPYKGNEHLLDTSNKPDVFFRTWKK